MDFVNDFESLMSIKSWFESYLKWFQTEGRLDRISLLHLASGILPCQ